jgi:2,4-dichlorophenol 6-monooxygenase
LTSLEQDSEGVTALIEDRADGHQYTVRARYLLGCDGGRVVGKQIGVQMEGPQELASEVSIHFSADLSPWIRDPEVLIRWLLNPDIGDPLSGVLVPMGPDHWGPQSEEWVFHLQFLHGDPRAFDDAAVMEHMRRVLGIPDFHPNIHMISRWEIEGIVAQRLRVGNVFLLGDSAHRHPPTGGLGLNTAVGDAYNLCWKIAAALRGQASDTLLVTYEQERKPVGARAVQRSLENWKNHLTTSQVLGMTPDKTPEENWEIMRRLWSDEPQAELPRVQFENAIASQAMEFYEQNVEYGYSILK